MPVEALKSAARAAAFSVRKISHQQGLDARACDHLGAFLTASGPFRVVSAYMPIRTEISPLPVMAALVAAGHEVCIPVVQGHQMALKFARWTTDLPMIPGPFGARIPEAPEYLTPDILITPLLAFDRRGFRLGYGGGFYDRTFAELRATRKIVAVGFAYAAQEIPKVPTGPFDLRLDAVVTEAGTRRFAGLPSGSDAAKPEP